MFSVVVGVYFIVLDEIMQQYLHCLSPLPAVCIAVVFAGNFYTKLHIWAFNFQLFDEMNE